MSAKIRFEQVRKEFAVRGGARAQAARFVALENVTLDVRSGEFLTLVGPSGCGKSTLVDLVGGLATPDGGRILVDGRPIDGPGRDRGIVFQQYALFPWRTAGQNIEFALEVAGIGRQERRDSARYHLELVGLSAFADRYPHELSGGMKQRVAIARSLACDPQVLLMDEPFAALDAQTRETLQIELLRIWRNTGKTIVFITHGIDEAIVLGQRVAVMTARPGRIKHVFEIPDELHSETDDVRSLPAFGRARHDVWSLLREEVLKARHGQAARTDAETACQLKHAVEEPAHV
jgi:NitT/TauT family transport system ATP-binding protein